MKRISLHMLKQTVVLALRPWLWLSPPLHKADLAADPVVEFKRWYKRAKACFWLEFPDAMCLSTIDEQGHPDGRMVLLKGVDARGFVFYTNCESTKGRSLALHPQAALTFYWEALQRQIRVQGEVQAVSSEEADEYFESRLRLSQLGAWASLQSRVLESRQYLWRRLKEFKEKFRGQKVPRPPYWSGFRVIPDRIEFWRLRPNRLHDRFVYKRGADGTWSLERLYP